MNQKTLLPLYSDEQDGGNGLNNEEKRDILLRFCYL